MILVCFLAFMLFLVGVYIAYKYEYKKCKIYETNFKIQKIEMLQFDYYEKLCEKAEKTSMPDDERYKLLTTLHQLRCFNGLFILDDIDVMKLKEENVKYLNNIISNLVEFRKDFKIINQNEESLLKRSLI